MRVGVCMCACGCVGGGDMVYDTRHVKKLEYSLSYKATGSDPRFGLAVRR